MGKLFEIEQVVAEISHSEYRENPKISTSDLLRGQNLKEIHQKVSKSKYQMSKKIVVR